MSFAFRCVGRGVCQLARERRCPGDDPAGLGTTLDGLHPLWTGDDSECSQLRTSVIGILQADEAVRPEQNALNYCPTSLVGIDAWQHRPDWLPDVRTSTQPVQIRLPPIVGHLRRSLPHRRCQPATRSPSPLGTVRIWPSFPSKPFALSAARLIPSWRGTDPFVATAYPTAFALDHDRAGGRHSDGLDDGCWHRTFPQCAQPASPKASFG